MNPQLKDLLNERHPSLRYISAPVAVLPPTIKPSTPQRSLVAKHTLSSQAKTVSCDFDVKPSAQKKFFSVSEPLFERLHSATQQRMPPSPRVLFSRSHPLFEERHPQLKAPRHVLRDEDFANHFFKDAAKHKSELEEKRNAVKFGEIKRMHETIDHGRKLKKTDQNEWTKHFLEDALQQKQSERHKVEAKYLSPRVQQSRGC